MPCNITSTPYVDEDDVEEHAFLMSVNPLCLTLIQFNGNHLHLYRL